MDTQQLLSAIDQLIHSIEHRREGTLAAHSTASEFLRTYAGPDSSFYRDLQGIKTTSPEAWSVQALRGFRGYVEAGLLGEISPQWQAQLDVVSDLLEQADTLLSDPKVHPAAPAVLIGATLEEFLRTWVEQEGLSPGSAKPGLETYSNVLRKADKIDKQDGKDITSWAGTRNSAAHGEWDQVDDRQRIRLMLEGVNLFMRKHEKPSG